MSYERWHQVHDDYVKEHGDDARPEAVAAADRDSPYEISLAPGGKWLVADHNMVQVFHGAHGTLYSAAFERDLLFGVRR